MNIPQGAQEQIDSFDGYPISKQILCHSGLLTPVLRGIFGDIYVEEISVQEDNDLYRRGSVIKQSSTGRILVTAELILNKSSLTETLLSQLRLTNTPFGQLLLDEGAVVRLMNQQFYQVVGQNGHLCLGRSHSIDQIMGERCRQRICEVKEHLLHESLLAALMINK